jgi:hypothetical protein
MYEQLSTWMDWIWSSRCLALLCTSTQSSNLKWVSGGGINTPRCPKSRWLKAVESSTIGWSEVMIFRAPVHLVLLVVALHCTWLLIQFIWRCVSSSGAEGLLAKTLLLASSWPSDRPTLPLTMASSATESFLARLCLDSNWASDRPTGSPLRLSVQPVLLSSAALLLPIIWCN